MKFVSSNGKLTSRCWETESNFLPYSQLRRVGNTYVIKTDSFNRTANKVFECKLRKLKNSYSLHATINYLVLEYAKHTFYCLCSALWYRIRYQYFVVLSYSTVNDLHYLLLQSLCHREIRSEHMN